MEKTSVEILPLSERGLYEVCQSADDAVSYALKLEEALEAAEKEISKLKLELGEGLTKNFFKEQLKQLSEKLNIQSE